MCIRYAISTLPIALDNLEALDRVAVRESMWLSSEEQALIRNSLQGFAVLCYKNETVVGGAFALPSTEVAHFFTEIDPGFESRKTRIYIYSVAVAPEYRHQGIGKNITTRLLHEARNRGFVTGCAHVTQVGNVHLSGRDVYRPFEKTTIKGFWPEEEKPDVEYQLFNL